uniref:Uncharacterized protein n=1 Tax=Sphaerodactylus townsendi TaxID=933632 RepID=A0ACB8E889_9SAUR
MWLSDGHLESRPAGLTTSLTWDGPNVTVSSTGLSKVGGESKLPRRDGLSSRAGRLLPMDCSTLGLIGSQQPGSWVIMRGVQSHRASQLECGSAQAGWFASSIQRKWNLGVDSIIKPADLGSMVGDGMCCHCCSMWSTAGQGSAANGIIILLSSFQSIAENWAIPSPEVPKGHVPAAHRY